MVNLDWVWASREPVAFQPHNEPVIPGLTRDPGGSQLKLASNAVFGVGHLSGESGPVQPFFRIPGQARDDGVGGRMTVVGAE